MQDDYAIEEIDFGSYIDIHVWTRNNQRCITVSIDSPTEATLQTVSYYKECTQSKPMKRGDGTIQMINYILNILKVKGIKQVILSDASTIPCKDEDGTLFHVSLPLLYFIKYKQTWYERKFNFKINTPKYAKQYEEIKELLRINKHPNITNEELVDLANKPCNYFTPNKQTELLEKLNLDKLFKISEWVKTL